MGGHATVEDDISQFGTWIADKKAKQGSTVLFMMTHHDQNKLFFDTTTEVPSILSANIQRTFSSPSIAILNACGTAKPGAIEVIRQLNGRGITSVIATSTNVDATMAGTFAALLAKTLREHSAKPEYTIGWAKFDAVKELSGVLDKRDPDIKTPYGARALIYSLIGNGNLSVCVPATTQE